MKHAIINSENKVVNIIMWDGAEWLPPRDHKVVRSDVANIGDVYNPVLGTFSKPVEK